MKLQSIQGLRAIACLVVIVYHLLALSNDYAHGAYYDASISIFKGGVDIFFAVSGVVMVITTHAKFDEPGLGSRFAIHRLARIYPPYWALTAILTVYWLHNPGGVNAEHGGVDLFASYTLLPSDKLPLVPVAWTLSYELMFYFVFFLFICFVSRARLSLALALWAGLVIVGSALVTRFAPNLPYANFVGSPFVLEFIGGCFVGLAFRAGRMPWPLAALGVTLVWFAAVGFWLHLYQVPDSLAVWLGVALKAPPAVLLVYSLIGLEKNGTWRHVPRWLVSVGDASYSLYLIHILVIHAAYRAVFDRVFHGHGALFLPFCFLLAVASGLIYFRIAEKPLAALARRWLERLTGSPHSAPSAAGS